MGRTRTYSSSHPYYTWWATIRTIIIVGAILTIILAIVWMIPDYSRAEHWFGTLGLGAIIWNIVWGIVHIVLAIGLLSGTGAIRRKKVHIWCHWLVLIIVGLVIVLPTGNWGGVVVVVAGVVGIVDRLD
ncbi:MAG: hypothetical protein Q6373_016615 [Candidatus Sigynarchaeota archaeon]